MYVLLDEWHLLKLQGENVWTAMGKIGPIKDLKSNRFAASEKFWAFHRPLHKSWSPTLFSQIWSTNDSTRSIAKFCTFSAIHYTYGFPYQSVHNLVPKKTNLWPRNAYRFLNCEWSPEAEKLKQHGVTSTFSSWTLVDHNRYPVSFSCLSTEIDGKQGYFWCFFIILHL